MRFVRCGQVVVVETDVDAAVHAPQKRRADGQGRERAGHDVLEFAGCHDVPRPVELVEPAALQGEEPGARLGGDPAEHAPGRALQGAA